MHVFILCDIKNRTFSVEKTFLTEEYNLAIETFRSEVDVQVDTLTPNYIINEILIDGKRVWGLSYSEKVCPVITGLIGWKGDKLVFFWSDIDKGLIPFETVPDKLILCYYDFDCCEVLSRE